VPSQFPPRRNAPLHTEYVEFALLKPMPGTPRQHPKSQLRAMTKSFEAFGQVLPILIDEENRIISGHAQWEVAGRLGMAELMVIRIEHLTKLQVSALMVALNRLGDLSGWDEAALKTIFVDLYQVNLEFDIESTGFTEIEVELRIAEYDSGDAARDDEILVGAGPCITELGRIWQLGNHRLCCGNALETEFWNQLMGDDLAALVFSDAPFNVPIHGNVSGLGRHMHREFAMGSGEMTPAEFTAFLQTAMTHAHHWSKPGSVHYWAMDWRHILEVVTAGKAVYERYVNMATWVKNQPGMGSFYRSQHELFFIFAKGGASARNNIQLGKFGRSRSNVWNYPSAASLARTAEEGNPLAMHPTVKPLALVCDVLFDASVKGDIIVDPFAGSGTTLIAAEKLGRKARCIEIDPAYCDTIIRRWQHWTGETAIRVNDGVTFSAVEDQVKSDGHGS
jgi:hypothetical protein